MFRTGVVVFLLALIAVGCDKGNKKDNLLPDTVVVPHVINLQGDNRLNSTVQLSWSGSDKDGYITAYEFSFDNTKWYSTTKTDSNFSFSFSSGSDTADIEFYVRAIDNKQAKDATPAFLKIPIKNTPPKVLFQRDKSSKDTALIISSLYWQASDNDGEDNLKEIQLKINDGDWYTIDKKESRLDLVPETNNSNGKTDAFVHFLPINADPNKISGLELGANNSFYIRAIDIANSVSDTDTIGNVYIQPKSNDLLVIAGDRNNNPFYKTHLDNVISGYDYQDYVANDAALQPASWSTSFYLLISQYTNLMVFADKTTYNSKEGGLTGTVLELTAQPIFVFNNNGGKVFSVGYFTNPLLETSPIYEAYPMQSMDAASAGLFLKRSDSALVSKETGYKNLSTNSFPGEFSPFQEKQSPSVKVIYTGDIDKTSGYSGPETVGIKKVDGQGKTNLVFITAGMNIFTKDVTQVDSLFHQVLNKEFQ